MTKPSNHFTLTQINLFVNITSAPLPYKTSSSSPSPTSTSATTGSNNNNNNVAITKVRVDFLNSQKHVENYILEQAPIIDLSTNTITSTSSNSGFSSAEYSMNNTRNSRSPQQPESSPQLASPQVPSPQGQTLDLSVNRISQR
jgi:hypothetical protein